MKFTKAMRSACLASSRLYLVLLPTEACNFRCVYCYEEFKRTRMEAPVLRGVKNLLNRRAADLDVLNISWFGGEPLLAPEVVEEVQEHVHSLLGEHPRIRFSANMTTNAYLLTRAAFEDLLALGVTEYQISFDGPRIWHDRKRLLPNGRGTFDRLWQNVTALREVSNPFKVTLRIHVDQDNQEAIPEFLAQCGDAFGGDSRFQLFIRPLSRLGGPKDDQLCTLDRGMGDERIEALRRSAASLGFEQYAEEDRSPPCYAAWANSFIVRADGRINKCSVIMEEPGNQVGCLNEDGTMKLDKFRMLEWMRGLRNGDAEELRCPMIGFRDPCDE